MASPLLWSLEPWFRRAALFAGGCVLAVMAGLIIILGRAAWPAFDAMGFSFFTTARWNPVADIYGAVGPLYGTVITSVIALALAVPLAFGIALFLTEIAIPWLRRPIGIAIELLAGIPSIIYGFWGLFILAPLMRTDVGPFLIDHLGTIPVIGAFFCGPTYGIGILTAGIVLAIMILPFLAAFFRDAFATVPQATKESAYALGSTRWDVVWHIVVPETQIGLAGGVLLGLGRALGETMAVTFVIGNAHKIVPSLLAPGTTIAATIANEFNEAVGDLYVSSLVALGLVLFALTFVILAAGRGLIAFLNKRAMA